MANFGLTTIVVVGAGSATLATAVSNFNTAMATALAAALVVANVNTQTIKQYPATFIFDATLYVFSGTITYSTGG